ncbi:adenylate isopentenyltransferase-like [Silene latifolia]|uniref:adenylate isopentenyltransferase-like n=1 Tax=Silene latifolia TaxID=37657 RepID=UPI003D770D73
MEMVVVIMGPTGSGKSRLSIDLATRFNGEVINSDKIQVYKGLNITTNKIPVEEQLGVPHHLLGEVDSLSHPNDFSAVQFRSHASHVITDIVSRGKLPFIVGGSNSFIYALLAANYSPDSDPFSGSEPVCTELRYKCCFLWVDVSVPVLDEYLKKRVDEMVDSGMIDELAKYYESEINEWKPETGIRKSIGVPEFEHYFKNGLDEEGSDGYKDAAVKAVKDNTCRLAKTQVGKILRLRGGGWGLHRLDGTDAFRAVLEGSQCWSDVWKRDVVEPSVKLVKHFLEE